MGFCNDDDQSSGPTTGSLLLPDNYQLFKAEFTSTLLFISVASVLLQDIKKCSSITSISKLGYTINIQP
jgi:hypothetical protein